METARRITAAILVTNRAERHAPQYMLAGLAHGLRAIGFATETFLLEADGSNLGPFVHAVASADAERTVLIDINARMRLRETRRLPRFSFLTDHPCHLLAQILDSPEHAVLGVVDRSHLDFLKILGIERQAVFFPHGGPDPDPAPAPIKGREIAVLFAGRLDTSPREADLRAGLAETEPSLAEAIVAAALAAAFGVEPMAALTEACARAGIDRRGFAPTDLCAALSLVLTYAETRHRHDLLLALDRAGVAVTMAGSMRDDFFAAPLEHLTALGPRLYAEVCQMMRTAKVVLNPVPVFGDGGHERIGEAMAAGATVVASPSLFLAETFMDERSILFLGNDPELSALRLGDLLADDDALQAIADRARLLHAAHHTWTARAGIIDRTFNRL